MKRILALILALVMMLSLIGCGNQNETPVAGTDPVAEAPEKDNETEPVELEPVTLQFVYRYGEREKSQDVIEVFNEKLAEVLPNTTVEFTFVDDYATSWPLFLAGGETMDIAWAGFETPFQQDVKDGNLIGLSALIEEYAPHIQEEMEIWPDAYNSATLDGEVWGIPCIQPTVAESQQFIYSPAIQPYLDEAELAAELHANHKMTEKTLDILEEAVQKGIDDGAFVVGSPSWYILPEIIRGGALLGYMPLGAAGYNMYFDPEAENPVAMHIWEIPEYKMMVERFAEWYDKGWVTETQVLGQLPEGAQGLFYFYEPWNSSWADADENGSKVLYEDGTKTMMTNKPTDAYVGTSVFGSKDTYLTIPYTSENPERAMMLIDILRDGDVNGVGYELMNLLCYGFEKSSPEAEKYGWWGYTAEEIDGQMQVVPDPDDVNMNKHLWWNWAVFNTFKVMHDGGALTTTAAKEYALNFYTDVYPQLKKTALAGMTVDFSNLVDEFDSISTVYAEYDNQFISGCGGTANVDSLLSDAMAKINQAGLEAIKADLQAQIDAYIA